MSTDPSIELSYEFDNGYAFDASIADSNSKTLNLGSLRADGASWFYIPVIRSDTNGEARLSSPSEDRFNWQVGFNVFQQKDLGNSGSGQQAAVNFLGVANYQEPTFYGNQTKIDYIGAFFALHYDVTDNLTIDVEGRYQEDKITSAFQSAAETEQTFKDFAPRVILTYQPTDDITLYGSWSRGVLPGFNNASVNLLSPALQDVARSDPAFVESVGAQKLDSYEIGIKQQMDQFRYAATVYHMKLEGFAKPSLWFVSVLYLWTGFLCRLFRLCHRARCRAQRLGI